LSYWDLSDDAQYPWRNDSYIGNMPMVARREVQYEVSPMSVACPLMNNYTLPINDDNGNAPFTTIINPPAAGHTYNPNNNDCNGRVYTDPSWTGPCPWQGKWTQMSWLDPLSYYEDWYANYINEYSQGRRGQHFDGAVIGSPNSSGKWGYFDPYYKDIRYCDNSAKVPYCGGPNYEQYVYQYGGTLADAAVSLSTIPNGPQLSTILPKCSTHWTSNYNAHFIPRGGFHSCGIVDNLASFFSVKYAETRIPYYSYDYFRPCGSDRGRRGPEGFGESY
jgi:hypothetical protein